MRMTTDATSDVIEPQLEEKEGDNGIEGLLKLTESQLTDVKKLVALLQANMRVLRKQVFVLKKVASRQPRRKKTDTSKSKASGFAAASELSAELKTFMGLQAGDMRSRTEVTKWLCNFIQEHKLQGTEDRRFILFETEEGRRLQKLLNCDKDRITYFDLQHYLKFHISSRNNPMSTTDVTTETAGTSGTADTADTVTETVTETVATGTAGQAPEHKVQHKITVRPRAVA